MEKIKNARWFPFYFCLLAIFIVPVFSFSELSVFDQKKIVQTAVLLAGNLACAYYLYNYTITGISWQMKSAIFLFFTLLVLSSLLAPLSFWALLQTGWYILLVQLLLLFSIYYLQNPKRYILYFLICLIALCVLYSLRVYTGYISGLFNEHWTTWPKQQKYVLKYKGQLLNHSAYLGFGNVRMFNHIQTWSLPLLAYAYLHLKDKLIPGLRYLLLFFISSWWMLVFASDARGTMLALAVSVIIVAVMYRKKMIAYAKVFGSTALGGFLLYSVLFYFLQSDSKKVLTRFGDTNRLDLWEFSLKRIAEHPFLGLGPMHFSYIKVNADFSTPHNFLLQSASEWGIFSIVLLVALVSYGFYKFIMQSIALQETKPKNNLLRITLLVAFLAATGHSMVSGVFNSSLSQLIFAIVGGGMIGSYFMNVNTKLYRPRVKHSLITYFLLITLTVNATFIGYSVISFIPKLKERQSKFMHKYNTVKIYPRFWFQGIIGIDYSSPSKQHPSNTNKE